MSLTHDTLIYDSDTEYLDAVVPFLREGIERGEGVVVASHERNRRAIGDALGAMADRVLMVPDEEIYRNPMTAIASYDNVLALFRQRGHEAVRAIGEVKYDLTLRALEGWLRYEPIAHAVFDDAPLHVICPYDMRVLPVGLIEHAKRTHPTIHDADARVPSASFEPPLEVLGSLPSNPWRITRKPDLWLQVDAPDAARARSLVHAMAVQHLSPQKAEEAVLAITEVLSNALRHGGEEAAAAMWALPQSVVCRVRNQGPPIEDRLAGLRPPGSSQESGRGLWIARQFSDDLIIDHDEDGPVVTLIFDRPG